MFDLEGRRSRTRNGHTSPEAFIIYEETLLRQQKNLLDQVSVQVEWFYRKCTYVERPD
ncbi:hypothetical protein Plhal703r1_c06g0035251 [Plasmopara halstedii]